MYLIANISFYWLQGKKITVIVIYNVHENLVQRIFKIFCYCDRSSIISHGSVLIFQHAINDATLYSHIPTSQSKCFIAKYSLIMNWSLNPGPGVSCCERSEASEWGSEWMIALQGSQRLNYRKWRTSVNTCVGNNEENGRPAPCSQKKQQPSRPGYILKATGVSINE